MANSYKYIYYQFYNLCNHHYSHYSHHHNFHFLGLSFHLRIRSNCILKERHRNLLGIPNFIILCMCLNSRQFLLSFHCRIIRNPHRIFYCRKWTNTRQVCLSIDIVGQLGNSNSRPHLYCFHLSTVNISDFVSNLRSREHNCRLRESLECYQGIPNDLVFSNCLSSHHWLLNFHCRIVIPFMADRYCLHNSNDKLMA
jgi:hypothetical protein